MADNGHQGSELERRDDAGEAQELLPGWSSLVMLLTLFALLSAITMMAILRGHDPDSTEQVGGKQAYGPADFPEASFDDPLLASVIEAGAGDHSGTFNVPPPPLTDGIYPCSECHADLEVNYERRQLEMFHDDIALSHGPESRWCFDCHNAEDRDHLRLVSGELVGFDESYRLCGQCHGTIFRDWRAGIHGRRKGYWSGAKSYVLCAHCHNPHSPEFHALKPLSPPVRPTFLKDPEQPAS